MNNSRREWALGVLRATRMRIQAERTLEGLPAALSDEEACVFIDVAREFGLSDYEQCHVVGAEAYERVTGTSGIRLVPAMLGQIIGQEV